MSGIKEKIVEALAARGFKRRPAVTWKKEKIDTWELVLNRELIVVEIGKRTVTRFTRCFPLKEGWSQKTLSLQQFLDTVK